MIEVEIKAKMSHPNEIIQRLKTKAIFLKETHQEDIYYNAPDRDFRITDEALRIRISPEGSELTYKGSKIGRHLDKTREEISVKIKNQETLQVILEKIGFQPVAKVSKKRLLFQLNDLSISLDFVKDLGEFIEVEGLVRTKKEIAGKRTKILNFLESLGIPLEDFERRSYLELLLNKNR